MSRSTIELMGTPYELFHWIPGEMIIIVQVSELLQEDALDQLVEQVHGRLNAFLAPYNLFLEMYGTYGRWNDLPAMPPIRRRAFLFGLRRAFPLVALFFHVRHSDPLAEDPLPMALSYIQSRLEQLAQEGLWIISAMPNWLVTAAPAMYYKEDGPAFPPHPAPTPEDVGEQKNGERGWRTLCVDERISLDANEGEGVVVAVLDTAQHVDRVRSVAARPEFAHHWLLQRLARDVEGEEGRFEIEYNRYPVANDIRTGRDTVSETRYYVMPDHGLFVAGLIRDIAPRAHIRLIRILNDFGGGDLYNLFAALTDLEHELYARKVQKLVINLSLTTLPDSRRLSYVWFDHRVWQSPQLFVVMRVLSQIEDGVRLLCESLAAHGAVIVGAAGNDSVQANRGGKAPRPPRAPARYESVIGVSSVNSRFAPSTFANAASLPAVGSGVATLGGDIYGIIDELGRQEAVRGLFISSVFPNGDVNETCWADWSGTSFSAAIVSGFAAHFLNRGWSIQDIQRFLMTLSHDIDGNQYGGIPDVPSLLANCLRVQQRYEV